MRNIALLKKAILLTVLACSPLVFTAQEDNATSSPPPTTVDSNATPATTNSMVETTDAIIDTLQTADVPADTSKTSKKGCKNGSGCKDFGMSVGLHLGTSGIGLQYNISLAPFVVARLEGNYIGKKNIIIDQVKDGVNIKNDISVTTGYVGLFGDFHVPGVKWLNLTIGGVYDLTTIKLVQTASSTSGESLGSLSLDTQIRDINPYVGIMLGKTIPKILLNTSLQIGTYYIGSPKVNWTGEGLIGPTADQGDIVEENIKDYSWMPVVSLHLNFKIK